MNHPSPIFRGQILDSKIVLGDYRQAFQAQIEKYEGREIELVLRPKRILRNGQQNRMLHVLFGIISDATGHTPAEVKTVLKRMYGCRFTSKMSQEQMANFIEYVYSIGAWLDVWVPRAGDMDWS